MIVWVLKLRRNDIVYDRTEKAPVLIYGRIVRFIDPETVLWINTYDEIHISKISDLEVVSGYKGKWVTRGEWDYFYPMPTLRKLKQRASNQVGRDAWKTPIDSKSIWNKP